MVDALKVRRILRGLADSRAEALQTLVLYGSSRGATRRLVARLSDWLHFPYESADVRDVEGPVGLRGTDFVILLCPTYGDDELQEDFEKFLQGPDARLEGLRFALCAPGSSDGYDYFQPGGGRILRAEMLERGATEAVPPLALDAMPRLDERRLAAWCRSVDEFVRADG